MQHLGTQLSGGVGTIRLQVGLDDLKDVFQPKWFYEITVFIRQERSHRQFLYSANSWQLIVHLLKLLVCWYTRNYKHVPQVAWWVNRMSQNYLWTYIYIYMFVSMLVIWNRMQIHKAKSSDKLPIVFPQPHSSLFVSALFKHGFQSSERAYSMPSDLLGRWMLHKKTNPKCGKQFWIKTSRYTIK